MLFGSLWVNEEKCPNSLFIPIFGSLKESPTGNKIMYIVNVTQETFVLSKQQVSFQNNNDLYNVLKFEFKLWLI